MIDPRIYRAAFAPAVIALVVLMFSVTPVPEPVRAPESFAADFDAARATRIATRVVERAPQRQAGSAGDAIAADMVASRFGQIEAGQVAEQRFEEDYEGEAVELRNVVLTLPGTSSRAIVVIAERDSPRGPGAVSSAAATGVLVELADQLGRTRHDRTLIFVSASGGADGASGMREFTEAYPAPELIDAVVVVARPGAAEPFRPHVLPWSTGAESTAAQLTESASLAVNEEAERQAGLSGIGGSLFRLALPAGMGAEAVAISKGFDAIGISSAGERPLEPDRDSVDSLAEDSMAAFGNATAALVVALDGAPNLVHGPDAYVELSGNLIPGWAIALLTLTLLVPALAAATDGLARAARRREPILASLAWATSRGLPFLAALALAYLLALSGLAPNPAFPFDPGLYPFGWRSTLVLALLAGALIAGLVALRSVKAPTEAEPEMLAVAVGFLLSLLAVGIWLTNPFLALLCLPLAHVWLVAARGGAVKPGLVEGAIAVALLPVGAATVHLAERFGLGAEAPWQLLLLVTGGQVGLPQALLGCLLAGALLGLVALAGQRRSRPQGPDWSAQSAEPVRSG